MFFIFVIVFLIHFRILENVGLVLDARDRGISFLSDPGLRNFLDFKKLLQISNKVKQQNIRKRMKFISEKIRKFLVRIPNQWTE